MAGNFRYGIKLAGNLFGLVIFLSPIRTIRRIVHNGSTENFSSLSYVTTLVNCLFWGWYSLPFVTENNIVYCTINCFGAILESIYLTIFIIYTPNRRERSDILKTIAWFLYLFGVAALYSIILFNAGDSRKLFCGYCAGIFSIIMYASPIFTMWTEIQAENVEYTSFLLPLFLFLCSSSWFVYRLLGNDLYFVVPNGIGFAIGAMQLILYIVNWLRARQIAADTLHRHLLADVVY